MTTTSLSSAWSVTAAVRPPRAAFVDHPLGRTAGKPGDREGQRRIVEGALRLVETATEPGWIVDLGERWGEDGWRAHPLGDVSAGSGSATGGDSRTARHDTPQYQSPDDARRAAERLGEEAACAACAVFDA